MSGIRFANSPDRGRQSRRAKSNRPVPIVGSKASSTIRIGRFAFRATGSGHPLCRYQRPTPPRCFRFEGFRPCRFGRRPLAIGELSALFRHLWLLRCCVFFFMVADSRCGSVAFQGSHHCAVSQLPNQPEPRDGSVEARIDSVGVASGRLNSFAGERSLRVSRVDHDLRRPRSDHPEDEQCARRAHVPGVDGPNAHLIAADAQRRTELR
jgi:hypothetical protein